MWRRKLPKHDFQFDKIEWVDDVDGGAVGKFYGTYIALEAWGTEDSPVWTIVFGQSQYGYQRGGRDGERTLDDIKKIAQDDAEHRMIRMYKKAKDTIAFFEARNIVKETEK